MKRYLKEYRKTYSRSQEQKKSVESGRSAWHRIRSRCNNPDDRAYGAKGIECRLTFEEFREIYFSSNECPICHETLSDNDRRRDKHARTIDRIDSAGHYEKGNVRVICRSCNSSRRKES